MNIKKVKKPFMICLASVCVLAAAGFYYNSLKAVPSMTYNEFIQGIVQGTVEEVTFSSDEHYLRVALLNDKHTYQVPNPKTNELMEFLLEHQVAIRYQDAGSGSPVLQLLLLPAIIGGVLFFRSKRASGGLIQNANTKNSDRMALLLQDIAGNTEAKAMVSDVIQFIKNPEKYSNIGAKMPRGILFYGPPGTGKTLMAKAIAGEAGVPFYPMSGADFMQMYVGVGASRIRELFKTAKKSEKAVIFIDEIDTIGKRRSKQPSGSNDERDQTLNALLTEMSGFNDRDGVVVIAATNRLDTLDEALTRPGRFDRLIEIELPDINAREKILTLHARSKALSDDVDMEALAKSTVSFSGAMLENLLNEAAILAANENKSRIEASHIDKAFYMLIAGAEKSDTSYITPLDRKITAYHEAGHALATKLLLPDSYISKVTIIPSTRGAGGFSLSIPKDSLYLTKQKMIANIKVLLAGRASEELIFGTGEITTGASNDIEKASKMILDYVNRYGMDADFGLFNTNVLDMPAPTQLLDICRERMKELYEDTKRLIEENASGLHNISSALLSRETISADDIDQLLCC